MELCEICETYSPYNYFPGMCLECDSDMETSMYKCATCETIMTNGEFEQCTDCFVHKPLPIEVPEPATTMEELREENKVLKKQLADEKKWRKSFYAVQKFDKERNKQEADGLRSILGSYNKRIKELEESLKIYKKLNESKERRYD